MRTAKLYPIDGGARWGVPWYDATGKRRAVTAATPEEAIAKRARKIAGWTSDEKLCDFLDWWTTECLPRRVADGRLAEETMDGYETSVRLHTTPRIGDVGLTNLTATLLEDWLDDLADDGLGPRGRQKALHTFSVAHRAIMRPPSSRLCLASSASRPPCAPRPAVSGEPPGTDTCQVWRGGCAEPGHA